MSVQPDYLNTTLPFEQRARDLVSRMTLKEKISQMIFDAPEIEHLGIPSYNWWNECLHGVGRAGVATVFPQAIGMAASWNVELMHRVASVISDEARAKYFEAQRQGDHSIYRGLTFWTPNINIFRDPRWGRGQETYGEDPYLTGSLGVAFVKGLQGDDPKYLKLVATPKHYAVHSGPEKDRHSFDARVNAKDLYETYLPAFKMTVDAGAHSVMGAYNRTNGEPCCASPTLLQKILREQWGFEGYVVSDCGAIRDIFEHHKVAGTPAEAAAMAVKAGCDLNCGGMYPYLSEAVEKGLIDEETIDKSVIRLFTARMKLGMFDPPEEVPWTNIPYEINDCDEHRQLARQMARESIVLLRNAEEQKAKSREGLLPLRKDLNAIAVIGPNADSLDVLLGNYYGTPSKWVTPLEGIRNAVSPNTRVYYAKGCDLAGDSKFGFSEAVSAAQRADAVIMCMGISPALEGEEGDAFNSDASGDRLHIDLPGVQEELIQTICSTGKPVVLVLISGSAVAINWAQENVPAIIAAWYPGEEGGNAIADVIFGDYNPAGRLPVTFYKSLDDVPPFEDYNMTGRTYRYFEGEPLYPFGFGLSYTSFEYHNLNVGPLNVKSGDPVTISASVTNAGDVAGDEVVQLYITALDAPAPQPIRKLVRFERIHLESGQTSRVQFVLNGEDMAWINGQGKPELRQCRFEFTLGGSQGDDRSKQLGAAEALRGEFEVTD